MDEDPDGNVRHIAEHDLTKESCHPIEQDQREPSLSIAARIACELEIPLDELGSTMTR